MATLDIGNSAMAALVISLRTAQLLTEKGLISAQERDAMLQATVGTFSGDAQAGVRDAIKTIMKNAPI